MSNWVQCTMWGRADRVWVNFGNAISIHRDDAKGLTTVTFIGENHTVLIKETVEHLTQIGFRNA
ncbi:hypothetical protein H8B02_31850 [Bradyrhizobium sp. Pear77]|uniref:hypothetical protein n=1 Tax=Bradyrhizobium altum TaxID=1571202 RepID=UPI001E3BAB57|nr:hypothetical protein [Bradyrhizobium altum]MCC8957860.1 hypothetical protein [Bradyrhizobium altum]